jgi:hypothetical protein
MTKRRSWDSFVDSMLVRTRLGGKPVVDTYEGITVTATPDSNHLDIQNSYYAGYYKGVVEILKQRLEKGE